MSAPKLRADAPLDAALAYRAGVATGLALLGMDPWEGNPPDVEILDFLRKNVEKDVLRRVLAAGPALSSWRSRPGDTHCLSCGATFDGGEVLDVRGYVLGETACAGDFHVLHPGKPR